MRNLLFVCCLWLLVSACVPGSGKIGSSGRKRALPPADPLIEASHAIRTLPDSLQVFLRLEDRRQIAGFYATDAHLSLEVVASSSESPTVLYADTLVDFTRWLVALEEQAVLELRIPLEQIILPAVLHIKVGTGPALQESRRMEILLAENLIRKNYLLMNPATGLPLFRGFINTDEPFIIKAPDSLQVFAIKKYEASFEPSLPPMASRPTAPARTLALLRTYQTYANDTVFLTEKGLYLIHPQEDKEGEGLLVEEAPFPELTTAEELIRPLIYLTSSQERERLYKAPDPKLAVDEFWLELAGDKNIARSLIRLYYGRVTEANRRYSSHKAGWLTDRGMIFIVFGPPQVLRRFPDREEWYYERNVPSGSVRFIFTKKQNTFTQNHYELVRGKSLEPYWYSTVEKWRRGMISL